MPMFVTVFITYLILRVLVFSLRSSYGSIVKVMDLQPAKLGSAPFDTNTRHWWQQETAASGLL